MKNPCTEQLALAPVWIRLLRLSYSRLGIRRGLGRMTIGLARRIRKLQLLPVPMTDGRVLYLDLRQMCSIPYLLQGTIFYEAGETMFIRRVVQPGDQAMDIGASVGWYSTLLSELVGAQGQVYAVEPNVRALTVLTASAQAYPQLRIVPLALSDQQGHTRLHVPADAEMGSLSTFPGVLTTQSCRVTTLDAFLEHEADPPLTFIKCDVEGAELPLLRGAVRTLNKVHPPMWMIEISDYTAARFGYHPAELIRLLQELPQAGYRGYHINSQSGQLQSLPNPITSRFNAVFVPRWQQERINAYQTWYSQTPPPDRSAIVGRPQSATTPGLRRDAVPQGHAVPLASSISHTQLRQT